MLVLSRHAGESVVTLDPADPTRVLAVVTVVGASRGKVRFGVTAPPEIPVHRDAPRPSPATPTENPR